MKLISLWLWTNYWCSRFNICGKGQPYGPPMRRRHHLNVLIVVITSIIIITQYNRKTAKSLIHPVRNKGWKGRR